MMIGQGIFEFMEVIVLCLLLKILEEFCESCCFVLHVSLQVRLGWHDAGTYNKNIEEWPLRGGANGSLRFEAELKHAANAGTGFIISHALWLKTFIWCLDILLLTFTGLLNALKLIQPLKDKYPNISYADLFQLASATAIEVFLHFSWAWPIRKLFWS